KAADLIQFRGALRAAKLADTVPLLFGGEEEEPVLRLDPDRSQGVVYVSAFTSEDKAEKVQKFCTDFRNRCGQLPDADAALSADAARVLFTAARKAGTFKSKLLLDEMGKLEMDLPTGQFWFTREGAARRMA